MLNDMKVGEIRKVPAVKEFRDEETDWSIQEGEVAEVNNGKGDVQEFQVQSVSDKQIGWFILGPKQKGDVFVPANLKLGQEVTALFANQFTDRSGLKVSLQDKVTVINPRGEKLSPMTVYKILGKEIVVLAVPGTKPKIHLLDWIALLWNIVKG